MNKAYIQHYPPKELILAQLHKTSNMIGVVCAYCGRRRQEVHPDMAIFLRPQDELTLHFRQQCVGCGGGVFTRKAA